MMRSKPAKAFEGSIDEVRIKTPFHLYSKGVKVGRSSRSIIFRATQAGLPAWWRLACPSLVWFQAFVTSLSWAFLVVDKGGIAAPLKPKLCFDFIPPRGRLVTLTRGPMARKKKSRVQLLVGKRVVQLRCTGEAAALPPTEASARGLVLMTFVEAQIWQLGFGTPLTIIRTRALHPKKLPTRLAWA